jgi:hypothetical protein
MMGYASPLTGLLVAWMRWYSQPYPVAISTTTEKDVMGKHV